MVSFNLLSYDMQNTIINTNITPPKMVNPGTENVFIRQETKLGGLEVHTDIGSIEIDTTPCQESMGVGQLRDESLVKWYADKGYQVADEATRRIVQQGDMVELNRSTQAEIKKQEFMEKNKPIDANIAFYPKEPPDITVNNAQADITKHLTEISIDWENTGIVPYRFEMGSVSFEVVQKAYFDAVYLGDPIYFPEPDFVSWA